MGSSCLVSADGVVHRLDRATEYAVFTTCGLVHIAWMENGEQRGITLTDDVLPMVTSKRRNPDCMACVSAGRPTRAPW